MGTEIEAKYRIDDQQHFATLVQLPHLAGYRLQAAPAAEQQQNTYYDTAERTLEQQRYGLRIRTVDGRSKATLKGEGQQQDGLFQRAEWEIAADDPHPHTWPAGEARDQALALLGDALLLPLLTIRTTRQHILAYANSSSEPVAELSLDTGTIRAADKTADFRELEIELLPAGTLNDLEALVAALRQHITLLPEPRSKLQRGLELLAGHY